jgi:hypothetical protein
MSEDLPQLRTLLIGLYGDSGSSVKALTGNSCGETFDVTLGAPGV